MNRFLGCSDGLLYYTIIFPPTRTTYAICVCAYALPLTSYTPPTFRSVRQLSTLFTPGITQTSRTHPHTPIERNAHYYRLALHLSLSNFCFLSSASKLHSTCACVLKPLWSRPTCRLLVFHMHNRLWTLALLRVFCLPTPMSCIVSLHIHNHLPYSCDTYPYPTPSPLPHPFYSVNAIPTSLGCCYYNALPLS